MLKFYWHIVNGSDCSRDRPGGGGKTLALFAPTNWGKSMALSAPL